MSAIFSKRNWILAILSALLLVVLFNSCTQYDYSSPAPGTLEVRLRAAYNTFDTLFSLNNFTLTVTTITAIRSDGIPANVYQDVKSIGSSTTVYNAFGRDAYDSALVIGDYPLPPATYEALTVALTPGSTVILDGYRSIGVESISGSSATVTLNKNFEIVEAKTTRLVLTVDLDQTLKKLAYTFQYDPHYSITSVSVH